MSATTVTTTEYYVLDEKGLKWSEPTHYEKAIEDLASCRWWRRARQADLKTFYLARKVTTTTVQVIPMEDLIQEENKAKWE